MRQCVNRRPGATIGRHSLSHALAGVPAPSEREPGMGAYHSSDHSETATLRAIFIAPTKLKNFYISPYNQSLKNFRFPPGERYRVGQGTHRIGTRPKRN